MELHKRRGPLTEPEVRYYIKQLSEGLDYLHDRKIIHRDLKVSLHFQPYEQSTLNISNFFRKTIIIEPISKTVTEVSHRYQYCKATKFTKILCRNSNFHNPYILQLESLPLSRYQSPLIARAYS